MKASYEVGKYICDKVTEKGFTEILQRMCTLHVTRLSSCPRLMLSLFGCVKQPNDCADA